MSDPERWLQSPELDSDVRDLLEHAPRPRGMSRAERLRTAQRVASVAAPVASGALVTAKSAAAALLAGVAAGGVFAVAVTVVPSWLATPEVPAERVRPATSAPPAALAPVKPPAANPEVALPEPAPEPSAAQARRRAPAPAASDDLAAEVALLERARRSLDSSPALTLSLLDEHAQRFAAGKLAAERELLRVDALQRSGRRGEALALAKRLLAANPTGLYGERLRKRARELEGN